MRDGFHQAVGMEFVTTIRNNYIGDAGENLHADRAVFVTASHIEYFSENLSHVKL
jgi:hypothetical protein